MTFYIMGCGLRGVESLTLREKKILEDVENIFVDTYTSIFPENFIEEMSSIYGKKVKYLEREMAEKMNFVKDNSAFISSGDPFFSTTHMSILVELKKRGMNIQILENSSIITAVPGRTGLSPYRVGATVSIPEWSENFHPSSFIKKIRKYVDCGIHVCVLIDLNNNVNIDFHKVKEIIEEASIRESDKTFYDRKIFLLERVGWEDERVQYNFIDNMKNPQSPYFFVIPSEIDFNEAENIAVLFK
ncbi:diphthine synthase [Caldiplasma sukawensis]